MKLCRFVPMDGGPGLGALSGIVENKGVAEIRGELWGDRERTGRQWPLDAIKLLPPSSPSKIVCVG